LPAGTFFAGGKFMIEGEVIRVMHRAGGT